MPQPSPNPRPRWFAIVGVRLLGAGGALVGVLLIARAHTTWPKVLGVALVLSSLYFVAAVTGSLARRWRTPGE